jgi:hypothetical protein
VSRTDAKDATHAKALATVEAERDRWQTYGYDQAHAYDIAKERADAAERDFERAKRDYSTALADRDRMAAALRELLAGLEDCLRDPTLHHREWFVIHGTIDKLRALSAGEPAKVREPEPSGPVGEAEGLCAGCGINHRAGECVRLVALFAAEVKRRIDKVKVAFDKPGQDLFVAGADYIKGVIDTAVSDGTPISETAKETTK